MKRISSIILLLMMMSCAPRISYHNINVKNFSIHKGNDFVEAKFIDFSGNTSQDIRLDSRQEIALSYTTDIGKGSIAFQLIDENNEVVWKSAKNSGKSYEKATIVIDKTGDYKVLIKGFDSTGKFKINWK